jgi:hypothetical protein
MFKKGDHIVVLRDPEEDSKCIKHGYCFLQGRDLLYLHTDTDLTGTLCGVSNVKFHHNDKWRYATPEEIAEYDRLGKPFDVTTLKPKELIKEELLEQARRRYPVGSRVKSLYEDLLDTVKGQYHSNYPDGWKESNRQIWFMGHVYGLLIYEEGKWAEVVSKTEEKGEEEYLDKIPVSKELTSLPEKWCIKDCQKVSDWAFKEYKLAHSRPSSHYFHSLPNHGSSFESNPRIDYTEITFDQFKKWVLKESVEVSLVGRYLKALVRNPQSTPFNKGDYVGILRKLNDSQYKIEGDWTYTTNNSTASKWELMPEGFVPPESKSEPIEKIEKGDAGTYVVYLRDLDHSFRKKGVVEMIMSKAIYPECCVKMEESASLSFISREKNGEVKWFATKSEAEEFAKTLMEPVENPEYVECIQKDARIEIGTVYKVIKTGTSSGDPTYYINRDEYFQTYFKPSTKEAYDAQFNPVKSETLAPEYIKCKSNGYSYRTHHAAKQYGAENYAHGELPVDGKVYKVIRRVEINPGEFGYSCTLNGKDYLIGKKGVTIATYEEFCLQQSGNPCIIQDAWPYDELVEYPLPEELRERVNRQIVKLTSSKPEVSVPVISFLSPLR